MTKTAEAEIVPAEQVKLLRPAEPQHLFDTHRAIEEFIQKALVKGKDYGSVGGSDRECLYKAGAERIVFGFGCRTEYEIVEGEIDHDRPVQYDIVKWVDEEEPLLDNGRFDKAAKDELKATGNYRDTKVAGAWKFQRKMSEPGISRGLYRYVIRCRIYKGDDFVGEGLGSCSSLESKYIRSPRDCENTVLKMAKKRAMVDSVLDTFKLSDRFTQDVEEEEAQHAAPSGSPHETPEDRQPAPRQSGQQQNTPSGPSGNWAVLKELSGLPKEKIDEFIRICSDANARYVDTMRAALGQQLKADAILDYARQQVKA